MTVYRHRIPESWGGWRGLYNYLPFDVCEVSGQGYNGSPNGEHGEKHMNFWCTIWHNLMGFKFDFSLFPILRRECRDGNSRGWPFIHECGLGSAQPCLVIFASKSPGGGEPACDRKWCGLILNWYPSPQRWATSYPWVSTSWDRHRDIFANMPLPGFKWLASAEAWPGRQKFSAVDLTVPNGQGSMKGSPESPGKPLMPGWQMELCFCFAFQKWWKKSVAVESFQMNSSTSSSARLFWSSAEHDSRWFMMSRDRQQTVGSIPWGHSWQPLMHWKKQQWNRPGCKWPFDGSMDTCTRFGTNPLQPYTSKNRGLVLDSFVWGLLHGYFS